MEMLIWLLYSDLSPRAQDHINHSKILVELIERLMTWQRVLSWGAGTTYQRDSVENSSSILRYIIYPPVISVSGGIFIYMENTNSGLPLITTNAPTGYHNYLLRSLLKYLLGSDGIFQSLMDLGFAELCQEISRNSFDGIYEGGSLSVVMMLMSILGYRKVMCDITGIEVLLQDCYSVLVDSLIKRAGKFVSLCSSIIGVTVGEPDDNEEDIDPLHADILHHSGDRNSFSICNGNTSSPARSPLSMISHPHLFRSNGNALLTVVAFLKRCVFLQSSKVDQILANNNLMQYLLVCYEAHPNNSMLHHELTDVIRFVLLDPAQARLPTCPLLNSLFTQESSILDFVISSFNRHTQYKGHMTTIANSIMTLKRYVGC